MHLNRIGKDLVIGFDSEEEAIGLHAFLSGTVHTVSPEAASKGQHIYMWFFNSVQRLATNFNKEKEIKTQTAETLGPQESPRTNTPTKKRRR